MIDRLLRQLLIAIDRRDIVATYNLAARLRAEMAK